MIGIRHEDKSKWEARIPLVPGDIGRLIRDHGIRFQVQTSPTRTFKDDEFRQVGAEVVPNLKDCPIILGVKEIPPDWFEPKKAYLFFSHTIKGQKHNRPMLQRILELGCTLIDYEKITDSQGRRLVFFGQYAGLAGMIDALWAMGQRLQYEGIPNPFTGIRRAFEYSNLEHAKTEIAKIGQAIRDHGLPKAIAPFVVGFAGYGNVSQGAQEIYDLLPTVEIKPSELNEITPDLHHCYKVVFKEEDMVERIDGNTFHLQHYYRFPEYYRSKFFGYLPHLSMLVNCIYWDAKYPRLVTCEQLADLYGGPKPRLRVIGDISCDIEGSIECTVQATEPGEPAYVYDPATRQVHMGIEGTGPVVLAVDILPCELPVDASNHFSRSLSPFIPALDRVDFSKPLTGCGLPPELQRATIVFQGKLTEPYQYMKSFTH